MCKGASLRASHSRGKDALLAHSRPLEVTPHVHLQYSPKTLHTACVMKKKALSKKKKKLGAFIECAWSAHVGHYCLSDSGNLKEI